MEFDPKKYINKFHHVGFVVTDLDRSIDFYVNHLGFELYSRWEESSEIVKGGMGVEDASLELAQIKGYGCLLELFRYVNKPGLTNPPPPNQVSIAHPSFLVSNIIEFINELEKRGVNICSKIVENPGDRWVQIMDPDGIRIEFMEWEGK